MWSELSDDLWFYITDFLSFKDVLSLSKVIKSVSLKDVRYLNSFDRPYHSTLKWKKKLKDMIHLKEIDFGKEFPLHFTDQFLKHHAFKLQKISGRYIQGTLNKIELKQVTHLHITDASTPIILDPFYLPNITHLLVKISQINWKNSKPLLTIQHLTFLRSELRNPDEMVRLARFFPNLKEFLNEGGYSWTNLNHLPNAAIDVSNLNELTFCNFRVNREGVPVHLPKLTHIHLYIRENQHFDIEQISSNIERIELEDFDAGYHNHFYSSFSPSFLSKLKVFKGQKMFHLSSFYNLEELELNRLRDFDPRVLSDLQNLKKLHLIDVDFKMSPTKEDFPLSLERTELVLNHYPSRWLYLQDIPGLVVFKVLSHRDDDLILFYPDIVLPLLKEIQITRMQESFWQLCPNLEHVSFNAKSSQIGSQLFHCKNLKSLRVSSNHQFNFNILQHFSELQQLKVDSVKIRDEHLLCLPFPERLKKLELLSCPHVKHNETFQSFCCLEYLDIRGTRLITSQIYNYCAFLGTFFYDLFQEYHKPIAYKDTCDRCIVSSLVTF